MTQYVRQALDAGARIFKIHLQVGGFPPDDPLLDPVWGVLAEAGVPVVVHAGHAPVGTEHTGPGPFGAVLARHPGLTAIIAHMGAPDYEAFLRLAADYERVALDTTMIFTEFFDKLAPFPAGALPLARELGLAGQDPARQRLPEHPLSVRPADRGAGPAGVRRRVAARRVLAESGRDVRRTGRAWIGAEFTVLSRTVRTTRACSRMVSVPSAPGWRPNPQYIATPKSER